MGFPGERENESERVGEEEEEELAERNTGSEEGMSFVQVGSRLGGYAPSRGA